MSAPILVRHGDKAKALQWLPWAESQLIRHKALGRSVFSKTFKPVPSVKVQIRSVGGIDYITIHAAGGGKCLFPVPEQPGDIISEWQLECHEPGQDKKTINLNAENYYPWADGNRALRGGSWWFGDPSTSQRRTGDKEQRTYKLGTFYPSLTTFTGFLPPDGPAFFSGKTGVGATNALAYADFQAKPWSTSNFGGFSGVAWLLKATGDSGQDYSYTGVRFTQAYDLTGPEYTLHPDATAQIHYGVTEFDPLQPSNGAVSASPGETVSVGDGVKIISDLTGQIGGSPSVLFSDAGNYAPLPTPATAPDVVGYVSSAVNVTQNFYRTRKKIILKRDGTIKQVGKSVHEKTDGLDTFTG